MKIFITGTDTDVGKTVVSSWLCLHTNYDYFKPIQTGSRLGTDSHEVKKLTNVHIHPESFIYQEPLSPHQASLLEKKEISFNKISLPSKNNLIIEGAGGILTPLNKKKLLIDLVKKWRTPVILVARTTLGTINHTLLSIEALQSRGIAILGVILNGPANHENLQAITYYGKVPVLAWIPKLQEIKRETLLQIPLSQDLENLLCN